MWLSQPPMDPTGIMARWLSKCWKTFWHLCQVLFNSCVYKIPVLTKENNLAYYSKNKFHIDAVIWQITASQSRLKNVLYYSVFCAFTPDLGEFVSLEPMIECDFTRKCILILQKALSVFMILCQGKNNVLASWTCTAVSGVIRGSTNSPSIHWIHFQLSYFSSRWSTVVPHTENQYFLREMQLLLKEAEEKFSRASAPAGWGKNVVCCWRVVSISFLTQLPTAEVKRAEMYHWLHCLFSLWRSYRLYWKHFLNRKEKGKI